MNLCLNSYICTVSEDTDSKSIKIKDLDSFDRYFLVIKERGTSDIPGPV